MIPGNVVFFNVDLTSLANVIANSSYISPFSQWIALNTLIITWLFIVVNRQPGLFISMSSGHHIDIAIIEKTYMTAFYSIP